MSLSAPAGAGMLKVEKDELKFGFIKLTDMAPLAIAYEKGFFEWPAPFGVMHLESKIGH